MRRRTRRNGWARAAALLVGMAAASPAFAQPAPKGGAAPANAPDPNIEKLKQHYAAGRAAADLKNWKKAAEEFGKAYELNPLPQLAGNLGEAELRLGRYRDAAEHILKFLREDKGATKEDKKAGEEWLAEARKKVVTFKITTDEPGTEVLIDDKAIGTSPLPPEIYVEPGKHRIVARKGTASDEVTDTYDEGWTRVVKLVPKKPQAKTGVTASPGIAGKPKSSGPRREVAIGGSILAGAAAGAGVVLAITYASMGTIVGNAREGVADGQCPESSLDSRCKTLRSVIDERNGLATASLYSLIGAAVIGGATIAYWYLTPAGSPDGAPQVRAGAAVGPAGAGLVIDGAW